MRIEIEIPKEFEEHFKQDRFEDTLHRLSADAHLIAGNYEQETAIMLINAFKESKEAYDVEEVVEELKRESYTETVDDMNPFPPSEAVSLSTAINLVRNGGTHYESEYESAEISKGPSL